MVWQVALDGKLVYGTAQVSWSHLTGEALPQRVQAGSELPAGTLNHDGLLVVQALRAFQDSTPAQIARLTAQAQVRPSCPVSWCMLPNLCQDMVPSYQKQRTCVRHCKLMING